MWVDAPGCSRRRLEREIDKFQSEFGNPLNFIEDVVRRVIHRSD
jgi:hypothetical protein